MTIRQAARRQLDQLLDRAGYQLVRSRPPRTAKPLLPPGAAQHLRSDHPRLEELRRRYADCDTALASRGYWGDELVARDLDLQAFRADNAYVWQTRHVRSNARLRYYLFAREVQRQDPHGWLARLGEDGLFGAVTFKFRAMPTVSRDLLDSVNELAFLDRHLGIVDHEGCHVLDIGAGYGRLAHRATAALPRLGQWYCVDAIPESTYLCEYYLDFRGCEGATVVPLDEVHTVLRRDRIDVAVNAHSFSEMTAAAARAWFQLLADLEVPALLVVPNEADGLFSLETDGQRIPLAPALEALGYDLTVNEPTLRDPDVRHLVGVRDRFMLFRRR